MAVIPDPGWVPNVVPDTEIESAWGNAVRDRLVHRFDTVVDRDAAWPDAPVGALCFAAGVPWFRAAGGWVRLGQQVYGDALGSNVTVLASGVRLLDRTVSFPADGLVSWTAGIDTEVPAGVVLSGVFTLDNVPLTNAPEIIVGAPANGNIRLTVERTIRVGVAAGVPRRFSLDAKTAVEGTTATAWVRHTRHDLVYLPFGTIVA